MQDGSDALLLVTHVPIRQGRNGPQIDDQTAAGIAQWCRHFGRVTYYGIADESANRDAGSRSWVDIADIPLAERCELLALPRAYGIGRMLTNYGRVRRELREAIARHRYLCFTLGSLIGDWPSVAAHEALRQRRHYAAWIDRVETHVIRNKLAAASPLKRLAGAAALPVINLNTRHLLRKSTVALLQGLDTFEHYAEAAPKPHCTYDTHTRVSDQIAPEALAGKTAGVETGAPINIVYVGRAAAMKGPGDWLDALERLHRQGVPFRASWIGDGPELAAMKERLAGSAIAAAVTLSGFEGDRETLLRRMRESDIMLFCHKTPESPRCLIEALVCGCALVGYETAYPRGLVEANGGGVFAPQDDIAALAGRIVDLHRDRGALARLIADAAASGKQYNEDAVYAHRASLMKQAG